MKGQASDWPTKHVFTFPFQDQEIVIRSDFDAGNLHSAKQLSENSYILSPALDSYHKQVTAKTFFHFKVENYPQQQITIRIQPLDVLTPLQKSGSLDSYRPWIRYEEEEEYAKMSEEEDVRVYGDDTLCLAVRFVPRANNFYLAFAQPYPFSRYLKLDSDVRGTQEIFVKKQVLCYSLQKRPVWIFNITSPDKFEYEEGKKKYESNIMFPQMQAEEKSIVIKKPVIFMTARVHPGEAASSFAMEGVIEFLLSGDLRAYILRRLFHFVIVPMINPDGVYNGFYRSDTLGNNLNRFYATADANQPAILSIKTLIQEYSAKQKLHFFFDFHGHPSEKGLFLYGNFMEDFSFQTEAYLFSKVVSMNCSSFSLASCNFTKTQMTAKDRASQPSKEGSGRVFTFRTANIPHSYTIEFGMHSVKQINEIEQPTNTTYNLFGSKYIHTPPCLLRKERTDINKEILSSEGISILISVLDILELNPYSRINKGLYTVSQLRKSSLKDVYQKSDRFRLLEKLNGQKILTLSRDIEESLTKFLNTRWMNNVPSWPQCMKIKRNIRLSSCVPKNLTSRTSEHVTNMGGNLNDEIQSIQTEQGKESKYCSTSRTNNKDSLISSFEKFKDVNSNTIFLESSRGRKNLKEEFKYKMEYWVANDGPNTISDKDPIQFQQESATKIKIKYKRLLILEKEFVVQKKECPKMVQINFDELRLQPQIQSRFPQTSKVPKGGFSKEPQKGKSRMANRTHNKLISDVVVYQSIFLEKQKQKQTARKTQEFKLASLLQPAEERRQQIYSDQRIRCIERKGTKLQKFSKSFKEKRRSKE